MLLARTLCRRSFNPFSLQHISFATAMNRSNKTWAETLDALYGLMSNSADLNVWATTRKNDKTATSIGPMREYLRRIECDISTLPVVHVAGTKGKGSTCAFVERILREAGLKTALFTSPHLIVETERFRINGTAVDQSTFIDHFWYCYDKLQASNTEKLGMPSWFRMMTLLGLHMFVTAKVDVAVIEVGIGGRADATTVVQPIVCGVSALGLDHCEVLGNTIEEIAVEKAGIFKKDVPAFSYRQTPPAVEALKRRAAAIGVSSLSFVELAEDDDKLELGIAGQHQRLNAALAVALAGTFLQRTGRASLLQHKLALASLPASLPLPLTTAGLPDVFVRGLRACRWPARTQVVHDKQQEQLTFFIDGAHTSESMKAASQWFRQTTRPDAKKIVLFACAKSRDAHALLHQLVMGGGHFDAALFCTFRIVADDGYNHDRGELPWPKDSPDASEFPYLGLQQQHLNTFVEHWQAMRSNNEATRPDMHCKPSTTDAVVFCRLLQQQNPTEPIDVFVTGSLYLAGAVLETLHENALSL